MRHVRFSLAVLLAMLWLPVSSHGLLVALELIHDHDDHRTSIQGSSAHHDEGQDEHGDDHDAADGNCLASAAQIDLSPANVSTLPWITLPELGEILTSVLLSRANLGLAPPGVAPPDLVPCWIFVRRAALPARAPSLAS